MLGRHRDTTPRGEKIWPLFHAPIVWAAHFCLSYATAAVWCAKSPGTTDALPATLIGFGIVAIALIALFGWYAWRQWNFTEGRNYDHAEAEDEHRREFLGHAGLLLALVSAVGVIYVTLPAFLTGVCT